MLEMFYETQKYLSTNLSCVFLLVRPLRVNCRRDNSNLSVVAIVDIAVARRQIIVFVVYVRVHVRNARRTVHGWIARRVDVRLGLDAWAHQARCLDAVAVFVGSRTAHSVGAVAVFAATAISCSFVLAFRVEIRTMDSLHVFSQRAWIGIALCAAGSFTDVRFLWKKQKLVVESLNL